MNSNDIKKKLLLISFRKKNVHQKMDDKLSDEIRNSNEYDDVTMSSSWRNLTEPLSPPPFLSGRVGHGLLGKGFLESVLNKRDVGKVVKRNYNQAIMMGRAVDNNLMRVSLGPLVLAKVTLFIPLMCESCLASERITHMSSVSKVVQWRRWMNRIANHRI